MDVQVKVEDFTADQVLLLKELESNGAHDGVDFTGFADTEYQSYEYDPSRDSSLLEPFSFEERQSLEDLGLGSGLGLDPDLNGSYIIDDYGFPFDANFTQQVQPFHPVQPIHQHTTPTQTERDEVEATCRIPKSTDAKVTLQVQPFHPVQPVRQHASLTQNERQKVADAPRVPESCCDTSFSQIIHHNATAAPFDRDAEAVTSRIPELFSDTSFFQTAPLLGRVSKIPIQNKPATANDNDDVFAITGPSLKRPCENEESLSSDSNSTETSAKRKKKTLSSEEEVELALQRELWGDNDDTNFEDVDASLVEDVEGVTALRSLMPVSSEPVTEAFAPIRQNTSGQTFAPQGARLSRISPSPALLSQNPPDLASLTLSRGHASADFRISAAQPLVSANRRPLPPAVLSLDSFGFASSDRGTLAPASPSPNSSTLAFQSRNFPSLPFPKRVSVSPSRTSLPQLPQPAKSKVKSSTCPLLRPPKKNSKNQKQAVSDDFNQTGMSTEHYNEFKVAAKIFILDLDHLERRNIVGSKGGLDTSVVKHNLINTVWEFLKDEGWGERAFGKDSESGATLKWPLDRLDIIKVAIPVLRRAVTNEKVRLRAQQYRADKSTSGKRRLSTISTIQSPSSPPASRTPTPNPAEPVIDYFRATLASSDLSTRRIITPQDKSGSGIPSSKPSNTQYQHESGTGTPLKNETIAGATRMNEVSSATPSTEPIQALGNYRITLFLEGRLLKQPFTVLASMCPGFSQLGQLIELNLENSHKVQTIQILGPQGLIAVKDEETWTCSTKLVRDTIWMGGDLKLLVTLGVAGTQSA